MFDLKLFIPTTFNHDLFDGLQDTSPEVVKATAENKAEELKSIVLDEFPDANVEVEFTQMRCLHIIDTYHDDGLDRSKKSKISSKVYDLLFETSNYTCIGHAYNDR